MTAVYVHGATTVLGLGPADFSDMHATAFEEVAASHAEEHFLVAGAGLALDLRPMVKVLHTGEDRNVEHDERRTHVEYIARVMMPSTMVAGDTAPVAFCRESLREFANSLDDVINEDGAVHELVFDLTGSMADWEPVSGDGLRLGGRCMWANAVKPDESMTSGMVDLSVSAGEGAVWRWVDASIFDGEGVLGASGMSGSSGATGSGMSGDDDIGGGSSGSPSASPSPSASAFPSASPSPSATGSASPSACRSPSVIGVRAVTTTGQAFAALREDDTVVT
jgi:hypothetical protein